LADIVTGKLLPLPKFTSQRLYVAVDGTTVHETDGWQKIKAPMICRRIASSAKLAMRNIWLNNKWEKLWQNKHLAA